MKKGILSTLGLCLLLGSTMAAAGATGLDYVSRAAQSEGTVDINTRTYAKSHGVSVDEAKRRVTIQSELDPLLSALQGKYKDAVAGIYIEHSPVYQVVVRLTGKGTVHSSSYQTSVGYMPVELRFGAAHSRRTLVDAINAGYAALRALLPDLQGVGVDERKGEVVVFVYSPSGDVHALSSLQPDVARVLQVPVRIEASAAREENMVLAYGGGWFWGASDLCTTGFGVSVPTVSTRYVTTAGHCSNSGARYSNWAEQGTPEYRFIFLQDALLEYNDAERDFQLHAVPAGNTVSKSIFGKYSNDQGTVVMSFYRSRANTPVGAAVCHRGVITGYSCGEVEMTNYAPSPGSCNGGICHPTWVSVTGPDLYCAEGDSGGPFFAGNTAFGLTKTGSSQGNGCVRATYMSVDYIRQAGYNVP